MLLFTTCGGLPSGLVLLVAVDIGGSPVFLEVFSSVFDADGRFEIGGAVPSGLSGLDITFRSVGFFLPGKAGITDAVTVSFD